MPFRLSKLLVDFWINLWFDKPLTRIAILSGVIGLAAVGYGLIVLLGTAFAVPATLALGLAPVGFLLAVLSPLLFYSVPLTRWFGMWLFVLAALFSVGSAVTLWAAADAVTVSLEIDLALFIGISSVIALVQLYVLRDEFKPSKRR